MPLQIKKCHTAQLFHFGAVELSQVADQALIKTNKASRELNLSKIIVSSLVAELFLLNC